MDFVCLVLRENSSGSVKLITQKATAEYFGWDTAFPEWTPQIRVSGDGGRSVSFQSVRVGSNHRTGGKRLVICRDKSTGGSPRGKTHCFRIKGKFSDGDLRRMAVAAGDRFEWMETRFHERRRRSVWLGEE